MTATVPASMGDRSEFQPRHPNAVPARCDGCPAPARWTRDGSRYCDEHAGLTGAGENAGDLNTPDYVQVDVNPPMTKGQLEGMARRAAARDGSDHYAYEIDGIGYDGHWANDIARLLAEVESRGRAIEALSARLAAKNQELDECIRAMRAASVELEARNNEITRMGKELVKANEGFAAIWAEINAWDLTDEQIERLASDINPVRRAEQWLKLTSYRACAESLKPILEPAPEMPRPPAKEADSPLERPETDGYCEDCGVPTTTIGGQHWHTGHHKYDEYWRDCRDTLRPPRGIKTYTEALVSELIPAALVTVDPEVQGGEPCMKGTRVQAYLVATLLEDHATWEQVREIYPSIPAPNMPVPAAQPPSSAPGTVQESTSRGTGAVEAPGPSQPTGIGG